MEEHAQVNMSKISRGEFLEAIKGPWKKAFTAENIQKSFEVTGTWPVNQSKITPDKLAPSKGLAIQGMPKIIPTSPIKAMVTWLEDIGRLAGKPHPSLGYPPPPLLNLAPPASPGLSTLIDIQEPTLDELLGTDLHTTRAAFLFDGSGSSSQTTVPPLELPPLPHFEPLAPSSNRFSTAAISKASQSSLLEMNATLISDNHKLISYANDLQEDIITLRSQITLLTIENNDQQAKLYMKEKKRQTAREKVNPGGKAIEATGDACLAAIEAQEGDRAAAAAAKAARQAGKGRRGVPKGMPAAEIKRWISLYDMAIANWKSEWDRLKAAGLAMKNAGPEPCKYWYMDADDPENITLPNSPLTLTHSSASCLRCHARYGVIHDNSSEADVDDDAYMQGQ